MSSLHNKKIKVLIVDDAILIRKILEKALASAPDIEVIGSAADPYEARDIIAKCKPDVMTLDIEMPKMDGLTFLKKVMSHSPIHTIIISSLTRKSSDIALKALECGAFDVMEKPTKNIKEALPSLKNNIISRIRAAYAAKHKKVASTSEAPRSPMNSKIEGVLDSSKIIAIASSTGGTETLKAIFSKLPAVMPPIVIVQHMPANFTKSYASSLNNISALEVIEANNGDKLMANKAYLAPGDFHMEIEKKGADYVISLNQKDKLHGVRPAADNLFFSVAKLFGSQAIGLVLTGMGKDGAKGLLEMKKAGSYNIAQDEETSIVFGMPKEAIKIGAIHSVESLENIPNKLFMSLRKKAA